MRLQSKLVQTYEVSEMNQRPSRWNRHNHFADVAVVAGIYLT